jgi:hypothetical protein
MLTTAGPGQPTDAYLLTARGTLAAATRNSHAASYTYDAFERLTQAAQTGGYIHRPSPAFDGVVVVGSCHGQGSDGASQSRSG